MRKISKIEPRIPTVPQKIKVAAYARVSVEKGRTLHSLSAQISYYNDLIQSNPEWEFAGIYADSGISGTGKDARDEFQRLISDCEAGKINIVLTKSISRFARNTVDLLETVRHLRELGIEVRFEKEHINSLSGDGELMLSILASFAQEEVISLSNNVKWGTRKRFQQGIPNGRFQVYGYRWEDEHLVIEPSEAEIVKLIYNNFLNGLSAERTEKQLEEMGVKSYKGLHFSNSSIRQILSNITYTGNLLFQKEYIVDPITKKRKRNKGELPQYYVEGTHEAIINKETYDKVQEEIARRRKLGVFANTSIKTTCFTCKIKCAKCGRSFSRSGKRQRKDANAVYYVWICLNKKDNGNKVCDSRTIPEITLKSVCAEVLGLSEFDENVFLEQVDKIYVIDNETLEFHFYDGRVVTKKWKSTARKDCWTEERRKACSELRRNKSSNPNRYNEFTGFIKCGCCGENFRSQASTYSDGGKVRIWRCCKACGNKAIKDHTMKGLVCDVLNLSEFSEEEMDKNIEKAEVNQNKVIFHFSNGKTETREFVEKKHGTKHTEEYKAYMSKIMKGRRKKKCQE